MHNCGNCHFWDLYDEKYRIGACKRFPPKGSSTDPCSRLNDAGELRFPETVKNDWCGEYKLTDAILVENIDKVLMENKL